MMSEGVQWPKDGKSELKKAFQANDLVLYLGAGVSVGSALPNWEKLVTMMFFRVAGAQEMGGSRPFSNYLYAIAEWYLRKGGEPLEITARKLLKCVPSTDQEGEPDAFRQLLHDTVYRGRDILLSIRLLKKFEFITDITRGGDCRCG